MSSFGLTDLGFKPKTIEDLRSEDLLKLSSFFGAIPWDGSTVLGQCFAATEEQIAISWEVLEKIYSGMDPKDASGSALDAICAITGTTRIQARSSTVNVTVTGDEGTEIPGGSIVANELVDFGILTGFKLSKANLYISFGPPAYAAGSVVAKFNFADNFWVIYYAIEGGVAAGTLQGTESDYVDGQVIWKRIGDGDSYAITEAIALETGPREGLAFSVNKIKTPVVGWLGALNVSDAIIGADIEKDPALRIRRTDELLSLGESTVNSIRGNLLRLPGVLSATVLENNTSIATDLPPHSIEAIVRGGESDDIAIAVFNSGIACETVGSVVVQVKDSQGIGHAVRFSRPEEIEIYLVVDLTVSVAVADTDVVSSILSDARRMVTGKDAVASAVVAASFHVAGVLDCSVRIGTAPAPTLSATIPISIRQLAVFDSSRITINQTLGTP
jgi:uncharacterized phage protein gp47/JayE